MTIDKIIAQAVISLNPISEGCSNAEYVEAVDGARACIKQILDAPLAQLQSAYELLSDDPTEDQVVEAANILTELLV